jgi:tetratricopeptide (TPR) repeat protein
MEAAELAFGDLEVLRRELEEFRQGRARILRVPYAVNADPAVEIRALDEAESARMDLMIRSKRGVDDEEAQVLVTEARSLVATYPQSAAVLLAATEAEFDARNYAEAESLAQRLLEIDPDSTMAAIYNADVALRRSFTDPAQLRIARSRFAAANRMENDHAYPLYAYYLTHLFDESEEVPEDAKIALEAAFGYAPFDVDVRQALIHLLLTENRAEEARVVGASFLTGQGGFACMLRKKFDEFTAGNTAPLLEEVRPDHPGEYLDEAAREARNDEQEAEIREYGCEVEDD